MSAPTLSARAVPTLAPEVASVVSVHLLDAFHLLLGGRTVELSKPAQRLTAYLAVHEGPVCRERVAADLWPDLAPADCLTRLRDAVYRVRRAEKGLVEGSGVWLSISPLVVVDVHATLARARAVLDDDAAARGVGVNDIAPPHLLPSWDEHWLAPVRQEAWLTCVRALECLAHQRADQRRFGDAELACRLVIDAEPYRESAYLLLAEVYLAEGNPGQALCVVQDYERRMRRELGLSAGRAVQFVERSIRVRATQLR